MLKLSKFWIAVCLKNLGYGLFQPSGAKYWNCNCHIVSFFFARTCRIRLLTCRIRLLTLNLNYTCHTLY